MSDNNEKELDAVDVPMERKLKEGEYLINGKTIQIKTDLPLNDFYDIPGMMAKIDRNDLWSQIPIMMRLIESWEFKGLPKDRESYGSLNIVKEILPISLIIQDWIDGEMMLQLKNSGREFGSQSALNRRLASMNRS